MQTASIKFAMAAMLGRHTAQLKMPRPDAYKRFLGLRKCPTDASGLFRRASLTARYRFFTNVPFPQFEIKSLSPELPDRLAGPILAPPHSVNASTPQVRQVPRIP